MDHYKRAWELMKADLVPWVILFLVFNLIMSFTGGLGVVLFPNLFRTVRDALREERAPDFSSLFEFDDISDDLVTMVLQYIANMIGALFCGVGTLVTGVLFWWAPMLAAEGEFAPMDAMKASMAHTKSRFVDVLVFMLVGALINFVGLLVCCVGIFVTAPVTIVAGWLYFEAEKEAILAAANAAGLPRKA